MLTPQDIQEIAFERAVFGGYDMKSVDDALEPLTQDYLALYKENAVLKSKMRLLVEKLEEYRKNEEGMKSAIVAAQKTCDDMIAEAEKECARLREKAAEEAKTASRDADNAILGEQERLNRAKSMTRAFIETAEANIKAQLEALGSLKLMDLTPEAPKSAEPQRRAYDYESEAEAGDAVSTDEIADEIQKNLDELIEFETKAEPAVKDTSGDTKAIPDLSEHLAAKFDNLQFGRNYNPTE